jgi:hypothetical protein
MAGLIVTVLLGAGVFATGVWFSQDEDAAIFFIVALFLYAYRFV